MWVLKCYSCFLQIRDTKTLHSPNTKKIVEAISINTRQRPEVRPVIYRTWCEDLVVFLVWWMEFSQLRLLTFHAQKSCQTDGFRDQLWKGSKICSKFFFFLRFIRVFYSEYFTSGLSDESAYSWMLESRNDGAVEEYWKKKKRRHMTRNFCDCTRSYNICPSTDLVIPRQWL